MSVTFVVIPTISAGWPFLCAAASVAASALGFKYSKGCSKAVIQQRGIELEVPNSDVITEQVAADEEIILNKDNLVVRIYKDPRGQCALHVYGEGRTEQELREEGTRLINSIRQQYVYQKVTRELENRGFSIVQENVAEEGRIRIRLRKFN